MKKYIVLTILVTIGITFVMHRPYDSTDSTDKSERSGLELFIDYGTGCHYVATAWGKALTPRMNANGKQLCDTVLQ